MIDQKGWMNICSNIKNPNKLIEKLKDEEIIKKLYETDCFILFIFILIRRFEILTRKDSCSEKFLKKALKFRCIYEVPLKYSECKYVDHSKKGDIIHKIDKETLIYRQKHVCFNTCKAIRGIAVKILEGKKEAFPKILKKRIRKRRISIS